MILAYSLVDKQKKMGYNGNVMMRSEGREKEKDLGYETEKMALYGACPVDAGVAVCRL
jgi:hypothetical protein